MKKIFVILLCLHFTNIYSQTKFWELVDIDKQKQRDEIDVQLMAINDKGTILIMSELISTLGVEQTLVMYRSFDNGKTWQSLTSKTEGIAQLKQQCILTAHDSIFYLTYSGGYMRSDNNGKTWNKYKNEQSLPNYEGNHWFVDSDTRLFQYYGLVTASHRTNKGWEPIYNSITPNGDTTRFIYYGNKVALTGIPSFQVLPNLIGSHCTVNRQTDYVSNQNWDDCNRSANQGMFVSKVFSSDLSCKSLYTILPFNDGSGMSRGKLFVSKDTGKTFQYIKANNNNLFKQTSILPILDESQIFIYAATNINYMNATTHYYRTKDRGYTWEQLDDPFGSINSIAPQSFIYAKDGTIFLGTSYGLYRGKEKVDTNTQLDDDYNVVFYAYGPTSPIPKSNKDFTLETSPTGHIYIGFFKNKVIEKVKGLSPTGLNLDMGKVDENTNERYLLGYHTHCFAVKITKKQYYDALNLSKSYYFSPISDCVSYAADVANLLELKTPKITDLVLLPFTYLEFLKNNNKGVSTGSELCNIKPKQSHILAAKQNKIENTSNLSQPTPLNDENMNKKTSKNDNQTSNSIVIGKLNSNFNTNEGWNTTNGEAIFEKGKVSLKPDKNGTPAKLFSNAFTISANARQLKLKIAKNLVGKGEIKVSLKNVTTNATDDIYSSKINNVISKIDNILTNTNKILDGNLNLKKIEPVFEAIIIDISKFAGTASLEIYFTNTGTSKQPIIIDGITIN